MKRLRILLSIGLGLTLLLQGFAVSAAPFAGPAQALQADVVVQGEMPCHGAQHDGAGVEHPTCCDADCPAMAACVLGHLAVATLTPAFGIFSMAAPDQSPPFARLAAREPSSLLRPPIVFHG